MLRPHHFADPFRVRPGSSRLVVAQATALARQVPVLHAILCVDAVAVAYTHYGVAPAWVTVYPLAALLVVCAVRVLTFMRRIKAEIAPEAALRRLRSTNRMAALLGGAFTGWAILLSRYGDSTTQMHAQYFLTITMIACVSCLMHLRPATRILALIAVPVTIYFALSSSTVVSATALNFAGVIGVLLFMQEGYYRDFCNLIRQYDDLGRLSAENSRLANRDTLTGLPNRRSFFARLEERIAARAGGAPFHVGVIDLDGFKPVNDTHGHAAGDEVLREVGARLDRALSGIGWAARVGGDEFGLVVEAPADPEAVGRTLCEALRRPYSLNGASAEIGASIGFAAFPQAGDGAEVLVERADYALYHAKAHHRGTAVIFAPGHEALLRRHSVIEQALRHADLESELDLVFQPIVDCAAGRVVAFEALARWTSPELGVVSPADFIPVAERTHLMHGITRVLLRRALAAARAWPGHVGLSFNLSTHDLDAEASVARIAALIAESGVAAGRIVFEVTETAMMRDLRDTRDRLLRLKEIGVSVALDDFGTGYSSLSYIHRLPIDELKIDRGFIAELAADQACRDIVKSVIDLCRNLRLTCVAEGVETLDQLLVLRALGCATVQGYLVHRPMPEAMIAGFLEAGPPALAATVRASAGRERGAAA